VEDVGLRLKYRSATGETRPWTLKEIIQGKPINRPTHPMLIHFPIAFYFASLALDVLSRVGTFPSAPLASTWALLGAFVVTIGAVATGLVDRSTMRPGSKARRIANRHMFLQFATAGVFVVDFALRWSDRNLPKAKPIWIVLGAVGVAILTVAADFGGQLVYLIGVRVGGQGEG
jgi:uncharacterized membrane protein